MSNNVIIFGTSKRGLPTFSECGGATRNSGYAQGICNSKGEEKTPIYIPSGGHLSNGVHAYFVAHEGDYVISVTQQRDVVTEVAVSKITAIIQDEDTYKGILITTSHYSEGEWDVEPGEHLHNCINAMISKSKAYHCRTPYYCKELKEKVI